MCENHVNAYQTPVKDTLTNGVGLPESFVLDINSVDSQNEIANERIDKSYWMCDYADDIFQTLREAELKRHKVFFRSQQCGFRPALLRLLKVAAEKHHLARTTLHLAVYLLDCFMDNYTIRSDKLNLTALSCLMVASKIEEADVDMPKFAKLNELAGNNYSLTEYKNVECKILITFNFDLLQPTTATFMEYFANCCLTLDDYHIYVRNWHSGMLDYHEDISKVLFLPPLYTSFEEMAMMLNKILFAMVDMSLNYLKFANIRPSILAAACIAAVRQLQHVYPIWTPYLVELTKCSAEVIAPYVDALIALNKMYNAIAGYKEKRSTAAAASMTSVLCDSPDSGIVSSDTKSDHSSTEDDSADDEDEEDEPYHCLEYPLLAKRRRLF